MDHVDGESFSCGICSDRYSSDIVEDGILEGHNIETKIGEIRITEIMGPKISLCKVNKGGETILTALNEGKTLKLISRQAKLFDE